MTTYNRLKQWAIRNDYECICSTETHRIFEENYEAITVQEFDGRYFDIYLNSRTNTIQITQEI
jgi:hypothetical protein